MRFALADSPFRNIHKYHDDDVLDYLDPHLRELAWHHHTQKNSPLPPCALVFGDIQGAVVWGYVHTTPGSFIEQVRYEAKYLDARRVLLLSELGSVSSPNDAALLAVEIQSPSSPTIRCAYDLLGPGRVPIHDDWTLPSLDIAELERIRHLDPVLQMVEESVHTSRLLGLSLFFCPVFVNPPDSDE